jgi:hypothetical protein
MVASCSGRMSSAQQQQQQEEQVHDITMSGMSTNVAKATASSRQVRMRAPLTDELADLGSDLALQVRFERVLMIMSTNQHNDTRTRTSCRVQCSRQTAVAIDRRTVNSSKRTWANTALVASNKPWQKTIKAALASALQQYQQRERYQNVVAVWHDVLSSTPAMVLSSVSSESDGSGRLSYVRVREGHLELADGQVLQSISSQRWGQLKQQQAVGGNTTTSRVRADWVREQERTSSTPTAQRTIQQIPAWSGQRSRSTWLSPGTACAACSERRRAEHWQTQSKQKHELSMCGMSF